MLEQLNSDWYKLLVTSDEEQRHRHTQLHTHAQRDGQHENLVPTAPPTGTNNAIGTHSYTHAHTETDSMKT